MAGLAPISLQQRCGIDGTPYPGARAHFFSALTLEPIAVWQDYGLGTPHPNPVIADAYGVFPAIFIDEDVEFYRLRITTSSGVILTDLTTLPVIGPTGGGGGAEVPVDPNALLKTGDPLWVPVAGVRTGFARMNGRTIGSATSGATERANPDTEFLFIFNWTNFSNTICPVIGGRGLTAAADWAANKQITMPDMRGVVSVGLDGMGNGLAGRLTSASMVTGTNDTALSTGGADRHTLTISELAAHDHGGATGNPTTNPQIGGTHTNTGNTTYQNDTNSGQISASGIQTLTVPNHAHSIPSQGGGAAHNNMPPFATGTWYQKL